MDHLPTPAEIEAVNNGHSLFAPSSGHMHFTCAASLLENFGKQDDGSIDAAYGTVGHSIGEAWLTEVLDHGWLGDDLDRIIARFRPDSRVGEIVSVPVEKSDRVWKVTVDERMLDNVERYVRWALNDSDEYDHFVETRVSTSDLTPIPGQGGTADHAACKVHVLKIKDLKMGRGEAIYPAVELDNPNWYLGDGYDSTTIPNGNVQAMLYAHGFITAYDHIYDFDEVIIGIAQPPLDYFQEWHTTKAQILEFGQAYRLRALENWKLHQPRTPSVKGCRWCKVKASCGAWLVLFREIGEGLADDTFDDETGTGAGDVIIEGVFRDITEAEIVSEGKAVAKAGWRPPVNQAALSTLQMEHIKKWRKAFEHWFNDIDVELLRRARNGEQMTLYKLVPGRKGKRTTVEDIVERAELVGLEPDDLYKQELKSPVELDDTVRHKYGTTKKLATAIVSALTERRDGQDTLVPLRDEREEIGDIGDVFDVEE